MEKKIKVIGFGSGLMDIVINNSSHPEQYQKVVSKNIYHAKESETESIELFKAVLADEALPKHLGGAMLNSVRCTKEVLKEQVELKTFFALGGDDLKDTIIEALKKENIEFIGKIDQNMMSACIIVLVKEKERSFSGRYAGGQNILSQDVDDLITVSHEADLLFADTYLIGYCTEPFIRAFKESKCPVKSVSLSATFIIKTFSEQLSLLFPFINVLFSNEEEFEELKNTYDLKGNTDSEVSQDFKDKFVKGQNFLLVKTCGKNGAEVFDFRSGNIEEHSFPAKKVDNASIVDTNGAGDSYAGGFLAGFVKGLSLAECNEIGNECSSQVVQLEGFQVPKIE